MLQIIILYLVLSTLIPEIIFFNKYGKSLATSESDIVGTISLYSSPVDNPSLSRLTGHSWIYIVNTSDKDIKILDNIIQPNDTISFGTTSNPAMGFSGIWVNLEGYNKYYRENISITSYLYAEDILYLENYLKFHNKWTLLYNCTTFSNGIWNNLGAGNNYKFSDITPKGLYNSLEKLEEAEINQEFTIINAFFPLD